nr:DExH-box ATP-dependent RNA helicase DExH14 [Tanacetum cinerariifolium]
MKFAAADEHPVQFLAMPEEALQIVLSQVTDQNLRHTLQFGIGFHHAGLNEKDRSLVVEQQNTSASLYKYVSLGSKSFGSSGYN